MHLYKSFNKERLIESFFLRATWDHNYFEKFLLISCFLPTFVVGKNEINFLLSSPERRTNFLSTLFLMTRAIGLSFKRIIIIYRKSLLEERLENWMDKLCQLIWWSKLTLSLVFPARLRVMSWLLEIIMIK